MPRIRYLKPDFFFDDDLATLRFEERLFFQGLWCNADREGRLEDKPKVLKVQILPYDDVDIDKILKSLDGKFILRYRVSGRKYIQIKNFLKHQTPHHTEKDSIIPDNNGALTVKSPSIDARKEKEKEKEKDKDKEKDKCSPNKLTPLQILWNKTCTNLSQVIESSKDRQTKEKLRLKERKLKIWEKIFKLINESRFCCGKDQDNRQGTWKASYDWIIGNETNGIKVLEGKYADKKSTPFVHVPEKPVQPRKKQVTSPEIEKILKTIEVEAKRIAKAKSWGNAEDRAIMSNLDKELKQAYKNANTQKLGDLLKKADK